MRPAKLLIVVAAVGLAVFSGVRLVRAQLADPPSRMELVDAARLDAAYSHLRELQAQARPYGDTIADVCKRYQISPADLDAGRVRVDFQTGLIARPKESK